MHIYQLVFISTLGIQFRNESISINNAISSLLCCHQLPGQCILKLPIGMYYQQNRSTSCPIERPYGHLQQLLLITSVTVKINPGTTRLRYHCGEHNRDVKNSESSIACHSYNKQYHKGCLSLGDQVFDC